MKDLSEIREKIDVVDQKMIELFEERMKLANEVAEYKIGVGKPIYDKERENEKLKKLSSLASNEFNAQGVQELFLQIMTISRRYQYSKIKDTFGYIGNEYHTVDALKKQDTLRVVYQGVEGAYSEQAMIQYFGEESESYHVEQFEDVMKELEEGRADYGVLPIENSSAGTVAGIYELLAKYNLNIVAEEYVEVNQALLALKGAELSDIKTVFSHPQGLMQGSEFLETLGVKKVSLTNTAVSAMKVQQDQDITQAAVASVRAAKLYDLEVLNPNINNNKTNITRFVILTKNKIYKKDAKKIAITFMLPHVSGSLFNTLAHFTYNQLSVTKIESKPLKDRPFEYRFFVEFNGNLQEETVRNALVGLEKETVELRLLGNF